MIIKCPYHLIPFSTTTHKHSLHLVSIHPDNSDSQVHKPIVPFSNTLKNSKHNPYMDKIIEIFNQININVPLLDAIQRVPSYTKFLKDMCTKKRKTNVPKKVFLATNIVSYCRVQSLSSTRIRVIPPLPAL